MDLIDGMKSFAEVVKQGSFTLAAERLGISNKLVSKYVGQLEAHLGTRLLNRTTRSVSLTETGQLYFDNCVQIITDIETLEASLQTQTDQPRGRLYISAPSTFGELHIAPLISKFQAQYPDIVINLQMNDRYVNLVDEGFDLAIRIGTLEDSALIARKLAPAQILTCASPEYLASSPPIMHPDDLKNHRCIADTNLRNGKSWPFLINGMKQLYNIESTLSVNSATATRALALAGSGIAICPSYVVGEDIAAGQLKIVLSEFNAFDMNVYAVYNNAVLVPPKIRAFVSFLVNAFKGQPSWDTF
ncbi:MAG: LysR family transcriptional regulator [Hyphomicrobiales bacterium]|nr:MAG: LysR family transcriptional regulator [Hyphomicrobiales bacterium]